MMQSQGLYDPRHEHDACGVGFLVDMKGRKSHTIVQQGLQVLINLAHRGASGSEVNSVDGAGIMVLLAFLISMNAIAIFVRRKFERRW